MKPNPRAPGEKFKPFHAGYVSEFEQFMDGYLDAHPDVVEDRQRGWYIWWDRRIDFDELDKQRDASVAAKPYQYE